MLTNNLPIQRENLVVAPRPIELVLSEDGLTPLTLILPPLEDMAEMNAHRTMNFSLKEFAAIEWGKLEAIFAGELEALEQKNDRFRDAPTFLNRLANLAELAGDRSREESFLRRVRDVADDMFVAHRLGENLIARNLTRDAEELFSSLNLERDAFANLRLAFFHVQRMDLDAALASVNRAASIDPLDFGVRLFEGSLHLVRGEYELAIQSFRFAAEDRQTSCTLFTNLALAYIYVDRSDKAFTALRKAVSLDPWNENAIALLADLAFSKGQNEDAIPSLRYFLQYEQKNSSMWARLARALLELGETNEAIAALKRQGSIENTNPVWNNLGVAYHRRRDRKKAYEAFKYAMTLELDTPSRNFFLAARNFAALLAEDQAYKEILSFTKAILANDGNQMVLSDPQLADIFIFQVHALTHTGAVKDAVRISEQLLSKPGASPKLTAWLASSLIAYYSLEDGTSSKALELVRHYESLLTTLSPQDAQTKNMLANNIAFAYLETGLIDAAQRYLQQLSHVIHKEPYPTATLGLFHMRKGNIDRAEHLYEEAIHLAKMPEDKKRIRQKLNLELGLRYFDSDPSRARRYLQKVAEHDDTVPQISVRSRSLLSRLTRPK
jgi:tetratricopeptide (TPR) repeat protein